jgi:hypothetical protein
MAEKDPKNVNEKAGQQTGTAVLTPEMSLLLASMTNAFGTIQQKLEAAQPLAAEQTGNKEFIDNAKIAVEKFNDILAGLELKPSFTPYLFPPVQTQSNAASKPVMLSWNMSVAIDTFDGFRVQRKEADNPFIDIVAAPLPANQREYPDSSVSTTPGATYQYRVIALTPDRGEFVSNVQTFVIPQA